MTVTSPLNTLELSYGTRQQTLETMASHSRFHSRIPAAITSELTFAMNDSHADETVLRGKTALTFYDTPRQLSVAGFVFYKRQ